MIASIAPEVVALISPMRPGEHAAAVVAPNDGKGLGRTCRPVRSSTAEQVGHSPSAPQSLQGVHAHVLEGPARGQGKQIRQGMVGMDNKLWSHATPNAA